MKKIALIILLGVFCLSANQAFAQKFGYLNSAILLSEHPQVKAADSELEALQKQLSSQLEKKITALRTNYTELDGKQKNGTITPKDFQDQLKKLQDKEVALGEEEKTLQTQLLKKREELYQPIIDEINTAIKDVAVDGGFNYIFDQSAGVILYADESQDVSSLVKGKLGI
jgi:outer membrane protein